MRELIILAPKPGGGVHTIAVNIAIGLSRLNLHVQLSSRCEGLTEWLVNKGSRNSSLLERNPGFIWNPNTSFTYHDFQEKLDYLLLTPSSRDDLKESLATKDALVLCVVDMNTDDLDSIAAVSLALTDIDPLREIDLFIPNKVKPGEWEKSSAMVFELAEKYGWEKIADSIPYCEAIHDLRKEKQSVWELPDNYNNRKTAFQSLVDTVNELGSSK